MRRVILLIPTFGMYYGTLEPVWLRGSAGQGVIAEPTGHR